MLYKIIPNRGIWLTFSTILVAVSIVAISMWGLNFGIDFTGGSLLEVSFSDHQPEVPVIQDQLESLELNSLLVQPTESQTVILRFQENSKEVHKQVVGELNNLLLEGETLEELRFDSVGPSIGQELKQKSFDALIIVLIIIVIYIALVFQKVSKPVSSWKYGIVAIIALFHDVLITLGVFAILGHFYGVEINTPFVAAILTVLGYSVNDTIIVFDRIRENLPKSDTGFAATVNKSVSQTVIRSINTSVTTLLVLLSILFLGGESIQGFILALAIGVFIGTYSSIFLASPLLVVWGKLTKK